jgi:hypothetical protein
MMALELFLNAGYIMAVPISNKRNNEKAFRGSSVVEQWTVKAGPHRVCAWKTCVNPVGIGRRFCDIRCKRKFFVDKRRRELKQKAIAYKGGRCERCGYATCEAALAFHHLESAHKDFSISSDGVTRSWERIRTEIDKCALLCANCHAEVHARQHAPKVGSVKTG